ncbi:hypothetical protein BT96DRAFT_123920 [Gymnopus androsaceus JB14]|uniref:Uncharacterized protein n=1 Tax=Gymnopus androsaceus JB14 TaxID=1447944 RepID=A0A6A4HDQ0_9AGAR|nr:hypothetical protein BT96DRAFT_123920 [Gymnopus androsaceus JB14]
MSLTRCHFYDRNGELRRHVDGKIQRDPRPGNRCKCKGRFIHPSQREWISLPPSKCPPFLVPTPPQSPRTPSTKPLPTQEQALLTLIELRADYDACAERCQQLQTKLEMNASALSPPPGQKEMITSQLEVAESELNASRKQLGQWERDKPFAFQPPDATLESNITILRKLLDDLKPKLAEAEALQKQVHASAKLIEQVDGDGDIKMEAPPPPLAGFSKRKRASSPSTALVAGHVAKLQSEYDKLAQQVAYVERNVEVEEEEIG